MMNINKEMVKDGAVIVAKATKESANKLQKTAAWMWLCSSLALLLLEHNKKDKKEA